ncbi:MAG: hypothetical protein KAH32_01820 [Chlamydiia bacterium]|nr:hypothetical protein [Chlamydiia bacterium]
MGELVVTSVIKRLGKTIIESPDLAKAVELFKVQLEKSGIKDAIFSPYAGGLEPTTTETFIKKFTDETRGTDRTHVWSRISRYKKENTLKKKVSSAKMIHKGTKVWETYFKLEGESTGDLYENTAATRQEAIDAAEELSVLHQENIEISIGKRLSSHNPMVAKVIYIKDDTAHDNIYEFIYNFDTVVEELETTIFDENTTTNDRTGEVTLISETVLDIDKRIKLY